MLHFRFSECYNLLGSTCVLHGIYSIFVLSDHLRFSFFFPVEFEEKVRSLRAPQQRFKPQQHTLRPHFHTSMKPRKEWGRGVVQNASFNPQNRTFGDQTWSPKKASSNTTCNPFRRGILRLGQLLLHLQQATCIPIAVEGWVPCGARTYCHYSSSQEPAKE